MKYLYLDCSMGAAGDMLNAALYELLDENKKAEFRELMTGLIPGVAEISFGPDEKCGIVGTHFAVVINGEEEHSADWDGHGHGDGHIDECGHKHSHRSMADVERIIDGFGGIDDGVKAQVRDVYGLIVQAEGRAHGVEGSEVHFHELGMMDAIVDVTGVCLLMNMLAPDRVVASPVRLGSGHIKCAHGILPVPVPATAELLKGVPTYAGGIEAELCTPTGAALLKYFVSEFGGQPGMVVSRVGNGMGTKDFAVCNCVRAFLGESGDIDAAGTEFGCSENRVIELECNVDDMTAEEIAYAQERLLAMGALDVYTTPIGMKKSRTGALITVMTTEERRDEMLRAIFRYTSTIGIREILSQRYILERTETVVETPYGNVRRKDVSGYGVERSKYEYEDLAGIARELDISIAEARRLVEASETE